MLKKIWVMYTLIKSNTSLEIIYAYINVSKFAVSTVPADGTSS